MPASLLTRMTRRPLPVTSFAGDETVALFPSLGHLTDGGQMWQIPVHGEIYSHGRVGLGKRFLLKMLQRAMKAPDSAIQSELFRSRISRFIANDCKGRVLSVRCGGEPPVATKRSRGNGHFFGTLRIPALAPIKRRRINWRRINWRRRRQEPQRRSTSRSFGPGASPSHSGRPICSPSAACRSFPTSTTRSNTRTWLASSRFWPIPSSGNSSRSPA